MITTVVDGEARLLGAKCACGTHTFPVQLRCPRCGNEMTPTPLPARGVLWTWTVQRIAPKPPYRGPVPFEPFAVGYVDLGVVKVESTLRGRPADRWSIGEPVRLVVGNADETGAIRSFSFEPAEAAS